MNDCEVKPNRILGSLIKTLSIIESANGRTINYFAQRFMNNIHVGIEQSRYSRRGVIVVVLAAILYKFSG